MRAALLICLPLGLALTAGAQDWRDFRGPDGQGHATERGLPLEWSEGKNIRWKVPVAGVGWSSPIVAHGRVWLTAAAAATGGRGVSLRVLGFDLDTGRQIVDTEVARVRRGEAINPKNTHASPSMVADDERVYAHFGAEGTAALGRDGAVLWTARFPYESQHGAGGSPILFEDLLIFSGDGADAAFVVALDVRTGKTRWKTERRVPFDQAYTTPLVIRTGDRDQLISIGAYRTAAYDPRNGKEIWRVSYGDGFSNVPRPVYGHGLVYIATGFQQPSLLAVRPDGSGDVTRSHVAWSLRRGVPLTPSPLLVGDALYLVTDTGIASSVDARTGEVRWQERLGGSFSASPVFADGRIHVLSEQGLTTVFEPGPSLKRLASNALDGVTLASMTVAARSFFIRSSTHLYRIQAGS